MNRRGLTQIISNLSALICVHLPISAVKKGNLLTADEKGWTRIHADLARALGFGGRLGKWGVAGGRSVIYGC
ncbi:hypothetical protein QUA82_25485 [Microcoleus sp. F8-D3]